MLSYKGLEAKITMGEDRTVTQVPVCAVLQGQRAERQMSDPLSRLPMLPTPHVPPNAL